MNKCVNCGRPLGEHYSLELVDEILEVIYYCKKCGSYQVFTYGLEFVDAEELTMFR